MSVKTLSILQQSPYGTTNIIPLVTTEDDSDAHKIELLEANINQLQSSLEYEQKLRIIAENKVVELTEQIKHLKSPRRTRCSKKELGEDVKEYSVLKSNGFKKAQAAEPIRSYDDFVKMQQYFLTNKSNRRNKIRDWAIWTIGVSLGLRVSDLFRIKMKYILNDDKKTFRKRLIVFEKKTDKLNNCLITESVIDAVTKYLDSIDWKFELDDYLFQSQKTNGKLCEEYGWKIISDAGKALNFPFNVGSHTMRKSFANIAACLDTSTIDMNAITKIQGLLNHSSQEVTMRYLNTFQDMYDRARVAVSDFVLGKTNVNELRVGNTHTIEDVFEKLDTLGAKFFDNKNHGGTDEK